MLCVANLIILKLYFHAKPAVRLMTTDHSVVNSTKIQKKANLQSSLKNVFAFYLPLCKNALFKVTIHYVYIISVTESL